MPTIEIRLAAPCLLALALIPGCGREHCGDQRAMVTKIDGNIQYLEGAETATKRQELETSCKAKYPTHELEVPAGTGVQAGGRWLVPWAQSTIEYPSRYRCADGHKNCMALVPYSPLEMYLRCEIPTAPGDYALADLGAELCESYPDPTTSPCAFEDPSVPHCVPLAGHLLVHSVAPICEIGACQILDADLTLQGTTDATASSTASTLGSAHLSVVFEDYGYQCHREATSLK